MRADPLRERDRPLEHLHAAHRAADHGVPAADAEVVGQPGLGAHHVADGDDREAAAVRAAVDRVRRRRAGGALAAAEHVDCTPRTSGRCRWPGPGPTDALPPAGRGVADARRCRWRGCRPSRRGTAAPRCRRRHPATPRLVGQRPRRAAWRRRRARTGGRSRTSRSCEPERLARHPRARRRVRSPWAWQCSHRLSLLVAACRVPTRCTREASLPGGSPDHIPAESGKAPWGFLPGCRTQPANGGSLVMHVAEHASNDHAAHHCNCRRRQSR